MPTKKISEDKSLVRVEWSNERSDENCCQFVSFYMIPSNSVEKFQENNELYKTSFESQKLLIVPLPKYEDSPEQYDEQARTLFSEQEQFASSILGN